MARPFTLKVHHTVNYWRTPSKPVPAKVIALTNQTTFTLKLPGGNTVANPTRQVMQYSKPRITGRWSPA